MEEKYDPQRIARYFDELGEREWERLEADAPAWVSFHVHRHYLKLYVGAGDRVLEAGAGAGRFTIELASLGAEVTVGDLSEGQLRLNREKVREAGIEGGLAGWELLDILDLSRFAAESFDAVVCYGGPLSYVFDGADRAMEEMLRVTKRGGHVLLSVMSLGGATRMFLGSVYDLYREVGMEEVRRVVDTGDLHGVASRSGHHCRMYRWADLEALLDRHPCEIVAASAANFLSVQNEALLEEVRGDEGFWKTLLEWEIGFCGQPGALDAGTHIIAVVRRR